MGKYIIHGEERLYGQVKISGAKNSVLPILAGTVLTKNVVLENVPDLSDVNRTLEILKVLGINSAYSDSTVYIENTGVINACLPEKLCKQMRSSILFMGALLGLTGEVTIPYPGGCALGSRPIDIHLMSARKMGADIEESETHIHCRAKELHGAVIKLPFPSVGATENIMLMAVTAKGTTIIENPAREPEILDLQNFLNKCGGKIHGSRTDRIYIEGTDILDSCRHRVIPDRIETGTFMAMAAATGGELFITNTEPEFLYAVINVMRKMGAVIKPNDNSIYIDVPNRVNAVNKIFTNVYPKVPTDMQPQLMAALLKSNGKTNVTENIFNGRNKHISQMRLLGANIAEIDSRHFEIQGVNKLTGASVAAEDLRGGAGLVIAGLSAEGETVVENTEYIERGYEAFDKKIREIGGSIYKAD